MGLKSEKEKKKVKRGDLMRVRRGSLKGAEGTVYSIEEGKPTIIEVRQLNGNPIRLPRSHFEFASFRTELHDG